MQVILLHPRFTQAKSLTLGSRHLALFGVLFVVAVLVSTAALFYLLAQAGDSKSPTLFSVFSTVTADDTERQDRYMKENLAAMATRLGEMQAQLMRLDALGERVQGMAGVKPEDFNFRELPGRGGMETPDDEHSLNMNQFQQLLDAMAQDVRQRTEYMNVVETALMQNQVRFKLLPTIQPVNVSYNASNFGWRLDPFTGRSAKHLGIDFAAPAGTPIIAAAGGVVIAAEYHHQFGNMLEIDHGSSLVTRYAHASKLLKKVGDIVHRGEVIAAIGSTGRSTGAHLHFEVLVKGVQQNPEKFLTAGVSNTNMVAAAAP